MPELRITLTTITNVSLGNSTIEVPVTHCTTHNKLVQRRASTTELSFVSLAKIYRGVETKDNFRNSKQTEVTGSSRALDRESLHKLGYQAVQVSY